MGSPLARLREALDGEFQFERELGGGTLGVLWLVRARATGRPVVLKTSRDESPGATTCARFLREARLLARVDDPRVVRVHRADEIAGIPYCIMEYLEGPSLAERLGRGPLGDRELGRLASDLLGGLATVHRGGIVHRDIKPANILWLADRAVLVDFGLARGTDGADAAITSTAATVGTPAYQAPEQVGQSDVGPAADLYSAAAVLYEAATGRRWSGTPEIASGDWRGVPRGLRPVLGRGLAWSPAARWPDAETFLSAFRRATTFRFLWQAGIAAALVLVAFAAFHRCCTPPPSAPADLALEPITACSGEDSAATVLRGFVRRQLDWYTEWQVEDAPARSVWRLSGRLGCGADAALTASIADSNGRVVQRFVIPSAGEPISLAAGVADSVVARLWPGDLGDFRGLGGPGRHPIEATRQYFAGEEAFHHDDWLRAEDRYRAALEVDSTFQLARWRLMLVRQWRRVPFEAEEAALLRHPGDLPPLQRELLQVAAMPDVRQRIASYARIASDHPRDSYAALSYANEVFVRGPLVGIPLDSGMALMREVERRHPGRNLAPALDHQAWGAIRLGDRGWAREAVDRRVELPSGGDLAPFFRLAYWERFHPALAPVLRWWIFRKTSEEDLRLIARLHRLALTFDLPDAQGELAELVLSRTSAQPVRGTAFEGLGLARVAAGRAAEAFAAFDSAAILRGGDEGSRSAAWCATAVALGWPVVTEARGKKCVAELQATDPDSRRLAERWGIAALAAGTTGDRAAVAGWLLRFDSLPPDGGSSRWRALVQGEQLAMEGRWREAVASSEPAVGFDSAGVVGGPFLRSAAHLRRARWLVSAGDTAGAESELVWYQNTDLRGWPAGSAQAGEADAVFGGVARLEQARLALARGDRRACPLVERVAWLWRAADRAPRLNGLLAPLREGCR